MLKIKEYVKAESLEEAYKLNQKKSSCVLGGMIWLKMGNRNVGTAIDLSGLGLDEIEETKEEFRIGCMVSLHSLEIHKGLEQYTNGAMRESLRHIVGVQFRNCATVGGSIYGRYGFSDVLTMFLAMDSYVELYKGGVLSMEEFATRKRDRDILVRIIIKKKTNQTVYLSQRNTKTDFPVITCAIGMEEKQMRLVVGARPGRAMVIHKQFEKEEERRELLVNPEEFAKKSAEEIPVGGNMRASAEYRSHLIYVLVKRAILALGGNTDEN
ncbi:MAG: FAD binding domain-containing protein [Firmicutes bacterium]|nr:FAD binding domain-containing protein [Bacillota bacterium]